MRHNSGQPILSDIHMELLLQLLIIAAGYFSGTAIIPVLKLAGIAFTASHAVILVLVLPIICTFAAEGLTMLWLHTPGTLGLGGLTVFIPMLVGGLINAVAAVAAQKLLLPFDPASARDSESLTGWLALAIVCSIINLGLWRFWPAPPPKLW